VSPPLSYRLGSQQANGDALEEQRIARHSIVGERFLAWQADSERRTVPAAEAVDGDRAAMQIDQLFDDSEAEPQPAMRSRQTAFALPELIEDVRKKGRLDSGAGIFDGQHGVAAFGAQPDGDQSLTRCELARRWSANS
jgi:hypothetical protein